VHVSRSSRCFVELSTAFIFCGAIKAAVFKKFLRPGSPALFIEGFDWFLLFSNSGPIFNQ